MKLLTTSVSWWFRRGFMCKVIGLPFGSLAKRCIFSLILRFIRFIVSIKGDKGKTNALYMSVQRGDLQTHENHPSMKCVLIG